jgi:hypothetical protein
MSDPSKAAAGLRERLTSGTEDRLGKALTDLLENPLVTGTIGRAFDARERAAQAQELAFGALNIPTAADIERLTRRLRSVSQRLEGIEDGVHRINRALSDGGVERRLSAMEDQLKTLGGKLAGSTPTQTTPTESANVKVSAKSRTAKSPAARGSVAKRSGAQSSAARVSSAKGSTAKGSTARVSSAKGSTAKGSTAKGSPAKGPAAKGAVAKRPRRRTPAAENSAAKSK